jgi:3-hydroxyacyl-CoA dehydrogenase
LRDEEARMDVDEIRHIGVIGAGLMGHGIALEFALAGYRVTLNDVSDEMLSDAMDSIAVDLDMLREMGLATATQTAPVPERIWTTISLEDAVADADFVVEAVTEDLSVKEDVFAQLDMHSPERTILASNSSTLMPSRMARATDRPDRVLVTHYFNPPYLVPVVEIVGSPETSDETIEIARRLLSKAGKRSVVLKKEAPGFIVNRLQIALMREALSIVEQGIASAEDIDVVVRNSFGRRLAVAGPFEVFESAGLDVVLAMMDQLLPQIESSTEVPPVVREMVSRGDLGIKTGKGFYEWTPESGAALRRRIAEALVAVERLSESDGARDHEG